MQKKQINLIAFDIPYPPDYGGVIDIYYKIKAFYDAGIKVHLHCFQYCRQQSEELKKICEKVYYYSRNVSKSNLFNLKPYIVVSRNSESLINNLLKNNFPILFEGLHCLYFLNDNRIADRIKIVRTHNIEHHYYDNLSKVEKNIFRKYYFRNEAVKLKRYEKILSFADGIAAISKKDSIYFSKKYKNVMLVSAFHPSEKVDIDEGSGSFALYHGSLDVGENNQAALFLVNKVFNNLDIPLIIAGNKPSKDLVLAVRNSAGNITIRDNILTSDIYWLLKKAHINILPTFQATGIKLKLLASLFIGRHCIVNSNMVKGTGLEELCIVRDEPSELKAEILKHFNIPFSKELISYREMFLNSSRFLNKNNILTLTSMLFPD